MLDALLPLMRNRAELPPCGASNSHDRQANEAIDALEGALPPRNPASEEASAARQGASSASPSRAASSCPRLKACTFLRTRGELWNACCDAAHSVRKQRRGDIRLGRTRGDADHAELGDFESIEQSRCQWNPLRDRGELDRVGQPVPRARHADEVDPPVGSELPKASAATGSSLS